jgi:hypothetical protein
MSARLKSRFTVYQFLVRLRAFKPTIWRRLRVADCTLSELHRVIQVSFGIPAAEPFRFVRRGRGARKAGVSHHLAPRRRTPARCARRAVPFPLSCSRRFVPWLPLSIGKTGFANSFEFRRTTDAAFGR